MERHRNDGEDDIKAAKEKFNSTIDIIKQVLGDNAFMAFDRSKNTILEKFSGSVYDSIIIPFSFFDKHSLIVNADKIREAILDVKRTDETYREDTYAATGSKVRVIRRIQTIYNLILNITGGNSSDNDRRLFTAEEKKELYEAGDKKCAICGNLILSIDDCEIDHIIPFTKGGKTELSNAQIAHRICNREKSNSTNDTWEEEEN
jgi:5-methylcytosine-specific restriction endonuclease McrA